MQVLSEPSEAYFNFVNSINSDVTRRNYEYCLSKFLKYCNLDLDSLLKLSQQVLSNLIIKYLVTLEISSSYKKVIFSAIRHACEMNDVTLNWKKLKKFIKSEKTVNEISGKDRGYTHPEIQKIVEFCDQRIRTLFLILASTGMRVGALHSIRLHDLEKIDKLYKITVYSGDNEEYFTFCTPECAKEIDTYLEFRKKHCEILRDDSFLLIKRFNTDSNVEFRGKQFGRRTLQTLLEGYVDNSGLREIDHENPHKRKQVPVLHGFRKFFTKQLVDSKLNPEIREMLLGHKIGLTSAYYKPTEQEMLNEYLKAVPLLTISNEERLKFKLEQRITIEKTQLETLKADFEKIKQQVLKRRN